MLNRVILAVVVTCFASIFGCSSEDTNPAGQSGGSSGAGGSGASSGGGTAGTSTGGSGGSSLGGSAGVGGSSFQKPRFPRLGATYLSNNSAYDQPDVQASLAKNDMLVLSYWPGWAGSSGSSSIEEVAQKLKALNPSIVIFLYVNNNELIKEASDSSHPYHVAYQKLESMGWWAYVNGASGPIVDSVWNPGDFYETNNTLFTPPDADGLDFVEWYAKWVHEEWFQKNPTIDGLFMDNVFWKPRVDADWDRDGTTDSQDDPSVQSWYRQGYVRHFESIRERMPGKLQIGNLDSINAEATPGELDQVLDGGLAEGLIGYDWSWETWGGFDVMMSGYRRALDSTREPKLLIFGAAGDNIDEGDFQALRYALGACLMDDGYFYYANGYGSNPHYDEFDVDLGYDTTPPPDAPWQNGVYRRDFENGIALVNPKGNGVQTVTLEKAFVKIQGAQAPSVNDGSSVTSVTLQDRDGLLLLNP